VAGKDNRVGCSTDTLFYPEVRGHTEWVVLSIWYYYSNIHPWKGWPCYRESLSCSHISVDLMANCTLSMQGVVIPAKGNLTLFKILCSKSHVTHLEVLLLPSLINEALFILDPVLIK